MRCVLAGTLLVVALAVAGCGGGAAPSNGEAAKTADQVVADAVKAAQTASSVHVTSQFGSIVTFFGRRVLAPAAQDIDLTYVTGKGAMGSMTEQGHKLRLTVIGTDAYINADAGFYRQFLGAHANAAAVRAGQWLKFPASTSQFYEITGVADFGAIVDSFPQPNGLLRKTGLKTYDGQRVVAIADTTGLATLYVSATGTPYPVALVKAGTSPGGITFGSWNKPVTLSPPSGAIDLSSLLGG